MKTHRIHVERRLTAAALTSLGLSAVGALFIVTGLLVGLGPRMPASSETESAWPALAGEFAL